MTTQTPTTAPLTGTYVADPVHSSFGFAVKHMGVSTFRGGFSGVEARLTAEDGRVELAGTAEVETISIQEPPEFRAHVLSAEFFDAERHPQVEFRSTDVQLSDDGPARVEGDLTLRGVTRPVTATGTYTAPRQTPGGPRAALQLEATVDRREFGIDWQMDAPGGGQALDYEVAITVDLELVPGQEG